MTRTSIVTWHRLADHRPTQEGILLIRTSGGRTTWGEHEAGHVYIRHAGKPALDTGAWWAYLPDFPEGTGGTS